MTLRLDSNKIEAQLESFHIGPRDKQLFRTLVKRWKQTAPVSLYGTHVVDIYNLILINLDERLRILQNRLRFGCTLQQQAASVTLHDSPRLLIFLVFEEPDLLQTHEFEPSNRRHHENHARWL